MSETRNALVQLTAEQCLPRKKGHKRRNKEIKLERYKRIQQQPIESLKRLPAHSLFAPAGGKYQPSPEEKKKAAELLVHVDYADYDDIERMWQENPRLMFVEVAVKDGKPNTPLKRALYKADTWTWRPFYEWIQQNQPDLVPEFLKQNAQNKHFDSQPLDHEYALYAAMFQEWWRSGCETSGAEIDKQWEQLFKKQNEILPFHMVREMCREGNDLWSPESKFEAKTAPKGGRVFDYAAGHYIKIDSDEFDSKFGSSLGLMRGAFALGVGGRGAAGRRFDLVVELRGRSGAAYDAGSIRQLCKIRIADLASIPAFVQAEEKMPVQRKRI